MEEMAEVKEAAASGLHREVEKEVGDLLFAVVNLSRHYKVNPEIALNRTNEKFKKRFHYLEKKAQENQSNLEDLSLEELDAYWNAAKRKE